MSMKGTPTSKALARHLQNDLSIVDNDSRSMLKKDNVSITMNNREYSQALQDQQQMEQQCENIENDEALARLLQDQFDAENRRINSEKNFDLPIMPQKSGSGRGNPNKQKNNAQIHMSEICQELWNNATRNVRGADILESSINFDKKMEEKWKEIQPVIEVSENRRCKDCSLVFENAQGLDQHLKIMHSALGYLIGNLTNKFKSFSECVEESDNNDLLIKAAKDADFEQGFRVGIWEKIRNKIMILLNHPIKMKTSALGKLSLAVEKHQICKETLHLSLMLMEQVFLLGDKLPEQIQISIIRGMIFNLCQSGYLEKSPSAILVASDMLYRSESYLPEEQLLEWQYQSKLSIASLTHNILGQYRNKLVECFDISGNEEEIMGREVKLLQLVIDAVKNKDGLWAEAFEKFASEISERKELNMYQKALAQILLAGNQIIKHFPFLGIQTLMRSMLYYTDEIMCQTIGQLQLIPSVTEESFEAAGYMLSRKYIDLKQIAQEWVSDMISEDNPDRYMKSENIIVLLNADIQLAIVLLSIEEQLHKVYVENSNELNSVIRALFNALDEVQDLGFGPAEVSCMIYIAVQLIVLGKREQSKAQACMLVSLALIRRLVDQIRCYGPFLQNFTCQAAIIIITHATGELNTRNDWKMLKFVCELLYTNMQAFPWLPLGYCHSIFDTVYLCIQSQKICRIMKIQVDDILTEQSKPSNFLTTTKYPNSLSFVYSVQRLYYFAFVHEAFQMRNKMMTQGKSEIKSRKDCIASTLVDAGYSVEEMEKTINCPLIQRDTDGFRIAGKALTFNRSFNNRIYRRVDGIRIDIEQSKVQFIVVPSYNLASTNDCLLDDEDLFNSFLNPTGDIAFSLELLSPLQPYSPLHVAKVISRVPSRMTPEYECMLHADLLLKYLTTGTEASIKGPEFAYRSTSELIKPLTIQLQNIAQICSRQQLSQQFDSIHRIWIQAGQAPIQMKQESNDIFALRVGYCKMEVKVKKLERSIDGEIHDADEEAQIADSDSSTVQFGRQFTENYDRFGYYFPELLRLRELNKLRALICASRYFVKFGIHIKREEVISLWDQNRQKFNLPPKPSQSKVDEIFLEIERENYGHEWTSDEIYDVKSDIRRKLDDQYNEIRNHYKKPLQDLLGIYYYEHIGNSWLDDMDSRPIADALEKQLQTKCEIVGRILKPNKNLSTNENACFLVPATICYPSGGGIVIGGVHLTSTPESSDNAWEIQSPENQKNRDSVDVENTASQVIESDIRLKSNGRRNAQLVLRSIADDDKQPSHVRGWIKNEIRHIEQDRNNEELPDGVKVRKVIRNPIEYEMAHMRGFEASKGFDMTYTQLQLKIDHKNQHKYDDHGKSNKTADKESALYQHVDTMHKKYLEQAEKS